MALIELRKVGVEFGERTILHELDWSLHPKEHALILGPSGSGKSTLLYVLGALLAPHSGEALFRNKRYSHPKASSQFRQEHIGFLFQDFYLIEHMTVAENIGLFQAALSRGSTFPSLKDLLGPLGMENLAQTPVHLLSRGERQRVAMARSLAHSPTVVLADEPTASLDPQNAHDTLQQMWHLCAELGTTAVVVSHDSGLRDASEFQQKMTLIQGKLVEVVSKKGLANE